MQKEVPSDVYDDDYYFNVCTGFDTFNKSEGFKLRNDQKKGLELINVRDGTHILDIGCGRGEVIYNLILKNKKTKADGIDYSKSAVNISKKLLKKYKNVNIKQMDATKLHYKDNTFDTIFMMDIVEHLYQNQLTQAISEAIRVLKKDGVLLIHTKPNKLFLDFTYRIQFFPKYIMHFFLSTFSTKYPLPKWNPRPEHDKIYHVNEQTPFSLRKLIKSNKNITYKIVMSHFVKVTKKNFLIKTITDWYPFFYIWPFSYYLDNSIYVIIKKQ